MSLPTRVGLAMALAWAGGFGLPGPPGWELLGVVVAIGLGWWVTPAGMTEGGGVGDRATRIVGALALALMLALIGRTLGRVIIASPAALFSVPVVGLGLILAWRFESRSWAALVIIGLAFAAAGFGAQFESRGLQARGAVFSGPVLGIHPRQAVAVQIDDYGPHDIIVDDFVDPPGGQGYDPSTWAAWLEAELHAIAERHYAEGPVRARVAFAAAEVEARESIVAPAERELHDSLLGVEVRSGTIGEGSRVEFVCPGQPHGPRDHAIARSPLPRACPRKYVIDGSTGLGLSPRWPGYTEVRGRDRARLARVFGWPTGEAQADRRLLALESGTWLMIFMIAAWLAVVIAAAKRKPPTTGARQSAKIGAVVSAATLVALALVAVFAPASTASASHGGPTLLAILLVLLPAPWTKTAPRQTLESAALPCALLLGLLAASPLAGRGDAVERWAIARDSLVELGLGWSLAGAFAGTAAVLGLAVGAGIGVAAMIDRVAAGSTGREGRHTRAALVALGLALALAVGLALRKPGDDLALLQSAAALLLLATVRLRSRAGQCGLAAVCALLAAAPLLDGDVHTPLALALVGLGSLLCVVIGVVQATSPRPGPS